jgi:subtilase family serine protease
MMRYAKLLTAIVVAALALPPPPSLAQQRGRQQIPPGGPTFPSGRVLRDLLPDLVIIAIQTTTPGILKCVAPLRGQVTIRVTVKNQGTLAAVMPPTMPTLGRYWVGVWDPNTFPGVMAIAAGAPSQLNPLEVKPFDVSLIVRQTTSTAHGLHYLIAAKADPANLILESNEDNNSQPSFHLFESKTPVCQ